MTTEPTEEHGHFLRVLCAPCGEDLLARVHFNDSLNCPAAHGAESIVPGEHDAILLRPIVAVGLVVRTFECAHPV
jgi:hypothetical protein